MSHTYPMKEIAAQAGVSLATVDRVLHGRDGVTRTTVKRVTQALRELERQSEEASLSGRKFMIDVVMEAPARFTSLVGAALEAEMPLLRPAAIRSRQHLAEELSVRDLVQILKRIASRGSSGVLLKAPDVPDVAEAVQQLASARIPVVTLVTDIPHSKRMAYVGIDNRAAGETAAYLIGQWLPKKSAQVLVTLSSNMFRGEEEREVGFRQMMAGTYPHIEPIEISEGFGRDRATGLLVRAALAKYPKIGAVYSIGGGNSAILSAFRMAGREVRAFVGHDLDADNRKLLEAGLLNAVLHHDLRQDMRIACQHIMRFHGALPKSSGALLSQVQVVTPFNVPSALYLP